MSPRRHATVVVKVTEAVGIDVRGSTYGNCQEIVKKSGTT